MKTVSDLNAQIEALEKELAVKNRELEIEAALEKVRSRSLAMHNSNELREVVGVVFDKLNELDFALEEGAAVIIIFLEGSRDHIQWIADPRQSYPIPFNTPYSHHSIPTDIANAKENGADFFSKIYPFEEKNNFFNYLFEHSDYKHLTDFVKKMILESKHYGISIAFEKNSAILIPTTIGKLVSEDQKEILKRFAKVFEQSYIRFLDLQKAEAQAREAQIQLALERVRARTMAMHHSSELSEAAALLFEQLSQLGVSLWWCGFNICKKDSDIVERWMSGLDRKMMDPLYVPLTYDPTEQQMYDTWKNGTELYTYIQEGIELQKGFEKLKSHPSTQIIYKLIQESGIPHPTWLKHHVASYKHGYLWIMTTQPFGETQIFVRFAKVFEQTYTRFFDLQKAEAQAREAQIEAALERVRARTMAMHKSDELNDVASLLFKQVSELGIKTWTTGFNVWSEDNNSWTDYVTNPQGGFMEPYTIDATQFPVFIEVSGAKKRKDEFFVQYVEGEMLRELYRHLIKFGDKKQFEKLLEEGFEFPSRQFHHFVFGSKVSLLFITYEPVPEAHDIFKRFGKVFEQTYTRFLDLQKAEAQAREAKIEAALERVRSRTMAMQRSDELREVVRVVFEQMNNLNFDTFMCSIDLYDKATRSCESIMSSDVQNILPQSYHIPYLDHPFHKLYVDSQEAGIPYKVFDVSGETKKTYDKLYFTLTDCKNLPEITKQMMLRTESCKISCAYMSYGSFDAIGVEPLSNENAIILQRFAKVFEQTYTRFLDLQKAEAQAREAQIEAALERVRARTMAMHKSDELNDVAALLFKQVSDLGIKTWTTGFNVWSDDNNSWMDYVTSPQGGFIEPYTIDATQYPVLVEVSDAKKRGDEFFVRCEEGEQLTETYRQLSKFGEKQYKAILNIGFQFPTKQYEHFVFGSKVSLLFITYEPVPEAHDIFKRFGKVFEQTYTRFLDLQKAEAQAREAQIEAALEKVRSRSLAMHHSDELEQVVASLFDRLVELGLSFDGALIFLFDKEKRNIQLWIASTHVSVPVKIELPYDKEIENNAIIKDLWHAIENGEHILNRSYSGETKNDYFRYVAKYNESKIPEAIRQLHIERDSWTAYFVAQKNSIIGFDSWSGHFTTTDEDFQILIRFARVFEQAYTRFLDLQKAEAQAKEAQIEAALEKIRSRSLAMQQSNELKDVVAILFEKLKELGLIFDGGAGIILFTENSRDAVIWVVSPELAAPICNNLPYDEEAFINNPIIIDVWKAKDSGEHILNKAYSFEEKNKYFDYVFKYNDETKLPEHVQKFIKNAKSYTANFIAEENSLVGANSWSGQLFSEDDVVVLKRVARVFEQAYIRFLDLQKAEAQAREAKIEAALERVRANAMAMQSSDELSDLVTILFEEFTKLDLILARCIIWIFDPATLAARVWMANSEDKKTADSYFIKRLDHPYYQAIIEGWKQRNPKWMYDLKGREKKLIDELLLNETELSMLPQSVKNGIATSEHTIVSGSFNNFGLIEASGPVALTDEQMEILGRFAKVFDLTYTRFNDLKQAEANAKEAAKQAALDRLRADIASMRTISDLDRITPLLWNELTILGVPFIRCGVFIMDDEHELIHTFLSTPEGKAIAAFHLPYDTSGNISQVSNHWHDKKNYIDYWDETAFTQFADILVKQGALTSAEQYLKTLPEGGFYLHFIPFLQGMLYVGNKIQLNEEEIKLIQSVADAFSTAYARYEDFNKLEAAKRQVDKTLVDLKQAQQQLIQSEKMASLGELTAGIAHEIQNPLNFVNNFSEVNKELIDELQQEMKSGNTEEAIAISNDVKDNEEKIIHHGKRADAIVKGMLQHSRVSTGQKEPTDINALADEYLRLSYHGMRAKDKTFNATLQTDFDKTIGKINVVPQDIGRVLLNLFNNAFYAVMPPNPLKGEHYEPTVTVSTKKVDGKIEIHVRDNGVGISQKVVDKIFQPFFTTKPTGQGTGLGLSLSYDIIKAHGGEIKVETKEGEGAEFVIQLPLL